MVVAQALLVGGCSCAVTPDYSVVDRGDTVEFQELSVPECYSDCRLTIDVANSYHVTVRRLYSGLPAGRPDPVTWDTRDEEGHLVPPDVYVMRARLNGERVDSWTVIISDEYSYASDASTDSGGEL